MNSDPNSDSEQCTESKLGRVHNAHTHGPGCAQTARALQCVVARAGPYRGPLPCCVAPVPGRVAACTRVLAHRVAVPCRAQGWAVLYPFRPYRDTPCSQVALLSRYKNCIVTQLGLNQDMRALPPCRDTKPHAARPEPCSKCGLAVSQPSCVVSWLCPAWPCALTAHPVS